jgi:hypothetical protein
VQRLTSHRLVGDKVEHAQEADMPIVNHLWLEACFIRWELLPVETNTRWLNMPEGYHFGDILGKATLSEAAIQEWAIKPVNSTDKLESLKAHKEALDKAAAARSPARPRKDAPIPSSSGVINPDLVLDVDDEESDPADAGVMEVDAQANPFLAPVPTATTTRSTPAEVAAQLVPRAPIAATSSKSRSKAVAEAVLVVEPPSKGKKPASEEQHRTPQVKPTSGRRTANPEASTSSATRSRITSAIDLAAIVPPTSRRAAAAASHSKLRESAADMNKFEEEKRSSAAKTKRAAKAGGRRSLSAAATSDSEGDPRKRASTAEAEDDDDELAIKPRKKAKATLAPLQNAQGATEGVDGDAMQVDRAVACVLACGLHAGRRLTSMQIEGRRQNTSSQSRSQDATIG